jgi:hypothetical protein
MEKIIVKVDSIKQNEIFNQIRETIDLINSKLPEALNIIGINKITQDLFDDLFKNNAVQTQRDYFKKVENDLSGISTTAIKSNMHFDAKEAYDRFHMIYTSILRQTKYIDHLSINKKGLCELAKKNESEILELAKVYISDSREIEIYKAHCEAANQLNKVFNGNIPFMWYKYFFIENGKIKPHEDTDYSMLISKE